MHPSLQPLGGAGSILAHVAAALRIGGLADCFQKRKMKGVSRMGQHTFRAPTLFHVTYSICYAAEPEWGEKRRARGIRLSPAPRNDWPAGYD